MSSAEPAYADDRAPPRWRFLIAPRWLGWHALMVASVAGMLALGDWQLRRAVSGNALSWAYTFEWPIFAGFAIVFWAKTIKDEFRPPVSDDAADGADIELPPGLRRSSRDLAADRAVDARGGAEDPEDRELAAYNAYLTRLDAEVKGHGRWHGFR